MGAPLLQAQVIQRDGLDLLLAAVPMGLGNLGELHIATEGEWKGHPKGPVQFTADVFDSMIARFNAQQNPIAVDYDHRTFHKLAPDSTAAGWIQHLEKRRGESGFELWAVVEWTDPAAAKIKAGEYKFCSPAFRFDNTDRKTGEDVGPELKNVALTNMPFLDGGSPVLLSFVCAVAAAEEPEPQAPPAAPPPAPPAAAPPPPEQAQAAEAQALNEQLTAFIDALAQTANVNRAAVVAALNDMTDDIAGRLREHLDADGVPQEKPMEPKTEEKPAPSADDEKRIKDIEASAAAEANTLLLSEVASLKSRVEAHDAKLAEREQREKSDREAGNAKRVDGMIKLGQLTDKERDNAVWLLNDHPERFESIYASRKGLGKPVPIGESQAGNEPAVDPETFQLSDLSDSDKVAYRLLTNNGMKGEAALKRIAEYRNKKAG